MSGGNPFNKNAKCDECGKTGVYDCFMGVFLCPECIGKWASARTTDTHTTGTCTTFTVEVPKNETDAVGPPEPTPCSGWDVCNAVTHIAHHIESAGLTIALAIFFGLVVLGGCLSK
jgi:hypothetical protein